MHTGGGRSLLLALLQAIRKQRDEWSEVLALLDRRIERRLIENAGICVLAYVMPGLLGRLVAERTLSLAVQPDDVVLCFGNLPPLFRIKCRVITYVQNTYVTATDRGFTLHWLTKFKIEFQRLWVRALRTHSDIFVVQTVSMRDRLVAWAGIEKERVEIIPFVGLINTATTLEKDQISKQWDFGYIALPWPHKNHYRLIEAFTLLAKEGITPSLVVTVPSEIDAELANFIELAKEVHGVRVTNLGLVAYERLGEIYRTMGGLIFPSLSETIGLPLLEAKSYGLPILAAERDYVRDVVVPAETFDPESPRSIMRAVLRFMGKPEEPQVVKGAEEFLGSLVRMVDRLQGRFRS